MVTKSGEPQGPKPTYDTWKFWSRVLNLSLGLFHTFQKIYSWYSLYTSSFEGISGVKYSAKRQNTIDLFRTFPQNFWIWNRWILWNLRLKLINNDCTCHMSLYFIFRQFGTSSLYDKELQEAHQQYRPELTSLQHLQFAGCSSSRASSSADSYLDAYHLRKSHTLSGLFPVIY